MLLLFDLWGESRKKVKWRHTISQYSCKYWLSFKVWFLRYRWKELSVKYLLTYLLTYILTYLLNYFLTDQPSHRISIFNIKLDLVLYRFYMDVDLDGLKNRAHTTNLMMYDDVSDQPTYFLMGFSIALNCFLFKAGNIHCHDQISYV